MDLLNPEYHHPYTASTLPRRLMVHRTRRATCYHDYGQGWLLLVVTHWPA